MEGANEEAPAAEEPAAEAPAEAPAETGAEAEGAAEEQQPEQPPAEAQEGGEAPQEDAAPPAEEAAAEGGEGGDETKAEGEEQKPDGEEPKAEGEEAVPAEGEEAKPVDEAAEGGEAPAEGEGGEVAETAEKTEDGETGQEAQPAEGEGEPAEKPTEGEEGEQAPAEAGQEAPAEGAEEGAEKPPEGEKTEEEKPKSPVPQSDTFAEGERPESPVAVGEKLSREGSPTGEKEKTDGPEAIRPSTPDREISDLDIPRDTAMDDIIEEEPAGPLISREELIERYHAAIAEREQLQQQNYQFQHKLAEVFRKKKTDDSGKQETDKNVTDQEQRYLKYMANLDELRRQDSQLREEYRNQIEELKFQCQEHQSSVDEERERYMEFKKQVALNSINSRSGKPIPPRDIEHFLLQENKKESEVVNVRLENIKLKNKLRKKELQLKSKEELAAGLHMIDFEQLKIENQTYNEKIEERNEELLKLRKKITSTVQVLTHLKEKLQFVQGENHVQKQQLREVEALVGSKRDILSRTKQARDALRIDNQRLRQNCGLLGNEPLLRDFEERKDDSEALNKKLEDLKLRHAELTLNTTSVRRKLEQARTGRP
ncbi:coiled-coil domain-containing protein 96 [Lingula anatina]|uniref:Coiled-coil domain-containing protein 96 n=1 Tax=Lingula anatina TaxID=7574 RepID=A0A1S3HH13_LINAN|nr:coiled-coil domain-containing protein 96 [Lingula anatina]|eukprot:XP_013385373.1 coiled-coil domain-containing protein 96 [Lingula anatina]